MRRVAITGLGIVSSLGNDKQEVVGSLREGRSGISFCQEYRDLNFRSHIHGAPDLNHLVTYPHPLTQSALYLSLNRCLTHSATEFTKNVNTNKINAAKKSKR